MTDESSTQIMNVDINLPLKTPIPIYKICVKQPWAFSFSVTACTFWSRPHTLTSSCPVQIDTFFHFFHFFIIDKPDRLTHMVSLRNGKFFWLIIYCYLALLEKQRRADKSVLTLVCGLLTFDYSWRFVNGHSSLKAVLFSWWELPWFMKNTSSVSHRNLINVGIGSLMLNRGK